MFAIMLLGFYRLNLQLEGRVVWFSDAQHYYDQYFSRSNIDVFNTFDYISFLRFSIIPIGYEAFQMNLANVSLTIFSSFISSRIIGLTHNNLKWYLFVTIYNPFILVSLLRNFKDAYFLASSLLLLLFYIRQDKAWFKGLITLVSSFVLFQIRPWAFLIFPTIFIIDILRKDDRRWLALFVLPLVILLFYVFAWDYLIFWVDIVNEGVVDNFDLSFTNRLLGFFKIFTSPGLIRPLFPNEYFEYSLTSVTVMIWIGQLINYSVLVRFLKIKEVMAVIRNHYHLAIYISLPLFIYAIAYGGSVEFRIKATVLIPMFALLSIVGFSKMNLGRYVLAYVVVVLVSSLMSV